MQMYARVCVGSLPESGRQRRPALEKDVDNAPATLVEPYNDTEIPGVNKIRNNEKMI